MALNFLYQFQLGSSFLCFSQLISGLTQIPVGFFVFFLGTVQISLLGTR